MNDGWAVVNRHAGFGPGRAGSRSAINNRPSTIACAHLLLVGVVAGFLAAAAPGREFTLSGVPFDLAEVTTNFAVYFTSLHLNRAANEWDVEVTLSNRQGRGRVRASGITDRQL